MSRSTTTSTTAEPSTRKIVHLNHAGASPSPDAVVNRMIEHLRLEQQLGGYAAAAGVHDELESVYVNIASLIHCHPKEIALVDSATTGWTRLFYTFCDYLLSYKERQEHTEDKRQEFEGLQSDTRTIPTSPYAGSSRQRRVILVSQVEYAANLVAACQWAKQHSTHANEEWNVCMLPSSHSSTGKVDVRALEAILNGSDPSLDPSSIALVCVTHIPTNSGIVNPIDEIGTLIQSYNNNNNHHLRQQRSSATQPPVAMLQPPPILYLVDACQSVGQLPVSVQECHCHGLVATGRKWLRGPRGTGFLYCNMSFFDQQHEELATLWPNHVDHYGAPVVRVPPIHSFSSSSNANHKSSISVPVEHMLETLVRHDARRFEFWESSIANRLGLGVAVQHALETGLDHIRATILKLATYLHEQLSQIDRIHTLYPPECGIVTFWIDADVAGVRNDGDGISKSEWWQEQLWNHGFEVTVSPSTSTPLDSSITQAPNLIRVSPSYTNTKEELDEFLTIVKTHLSTW